MTDTTNDKSTNNKPQDNAMKNRNEIIEKVISALVKADPAEFESDIDNGGMIRAKSLAEAIADELLAA